MVLLADLEAIVGPRSEFHDARLLVEWEILDVDLAGGLINCRRLPFHPSGVVESGFGGQCHLEIPISTVTKKQI